MSDGGSEPARRRGLCRATTRDRLSAPAQCPSPCGGRAGTLDEVHQPDESCAIHDLVASAQVMALTTLDLVG
jgi:acetylornithine deacetylase/succinyl-diaminopimelate desuccinylase-like protein